MIAFSNLKKITEANKVNFKTITKDEINAIELLWNELRGVHSAESHYFKDHYKQFTFKKYCNKINSIDEDDLRMEVIDNSGTLVGYCVSIMEGDTGDMDSIFIDPEYRRFGYGGKLIKDALKWIKEKKAKKVIVTVASGHDSIFGFYQKYGFYPKTTNLQLRESVQKYVKYL